MNQLQISCYIVTFNEADRVSVPILSVRDWVDEVIVIDSGSTDDTVAVCEGLGARVIHHDWPGYGYQKRFAEEQCAHNWVLNLDADEEVPAALRSEIFSLFENGMPQENAYELQIKDLLPGEKKLALGAHTDFRTRLYDKTKARVMKSDVYDAVELLEGNLVRLKAPLLHRSFRNLYHMIGKINQYSNVQAENLVKQRKKYLTFRLIIEVPFAFLKMYILRGYILRGRRGFIYSVVHSYGRFIRLAKTIELMEKNN